MTRLFALIAVATGLAAACSPSNSQTGPTKGGSGVTPTAPSAPIPTPPDQPVPGNGINGVYQGDLTFTEEDIRYGWPAHLTVVATLQQNGTDVTGDFDLREVPYSGGYVAGRVDPGAGGDALGTFRADFQPDDLGDEFAIETKITSPDGSGFEGTFVFAGGVVGRGKATFTRVK